MSRTAHCNESDQLLDHRIFLFTCGKPLSGRATHPSICSYKAAHNPRSDFVLVLSCGLRRRLISTPPGLFARLKSHTGGLVSMSSIEQWTPIPNQKNRKSAHSRWVEQSGSLPPYYELFLLVDNTRTSAWPGQAPFASDIMWSMDRKERSI